MNLKNFETQVDSKILARGRDYYKSDTILSLEHDGAEWIAEVEGSEDYEVSVTISDNGEITDTYCDCPYDWGIYCKHQVAIFFALKEKGTNLGIEMKEQTKNKVKSKQSLENILSKLDKQTLISLLMEYAESNKTIKSDIQLRYAEKDDIAKSARQVIKNAINAVSHRGYVEYRYVDASTDGADTVLQMIGDKIDSNELLTAVLLGIIVAEEMMDLLGYCDDSNGTVGGAISEAIGRIGDAILSMPENYIDGKKIFNAVFSHSLSDSYSGWTDWRFDLLSTLIPLCYNSEHRTQLENYLSTSDNQKTNDFSRDYDLRQKQRIQLEIIKQFDNEISAMHYIEHNLDNFDFRCTAIRLSMENKDYTNAISLCIEGEEMHSNSVCYVRTLQEHRYSAYEAEGNQHEQKKLALAFLLDGKFDYFLKYKDLHHKSEWQEILNDILNKIEKNSRRGIYVQILVHEKLKPQLLNYCEKSPKSIEYYYKELLPEYKNEVGKIFSNYIGALATGADNRRDYGEVCRLIKMCDKACPGATDNVCNEIFEKYAKRPAFMDEMRKIKKFKGGGSK